ncbi:DUF1631 domain-containing protein [Diaphorobacter sp. HDW4A]|uniref:DUF1631 family protein n=1 Tax=Diaphorobacter sp. HDW4A TaxID=2714924 RepID=UPI0014084B95|nr:DUF1631 family protein [Diaphorobacter sp. HDW4A]QIL79095.1 DUF1631 domain-containing protein [Diaphorobacter sp. HDW4A]
MPPNSDSFSQAFESSVLNDGTISDSRPVAVSTNSASLRRWLDELKQRQPLPTALGQVVQSFELPLIRLVQRDAAALSDERHASRKLIDTVIERGLRYPDASSEKFERFIALANQTVRHLTTLPVHDAAAFEHMHRMWNRAWEKPSSTSLAAMAAAGYPDAFQDLIRENASAFESLPTARLAPALWLEFLTGPWARVAAHSQCSTNKQRAGKYLTMAPVLLWCVQPDIERDDARRLLSWTSELANLVGEGLASVGYREVDIAPMQQRITRLHAHLAKIAETEPQETAETATELQTPTNADVDIHIEPYQAGQWFDMWIQQRCIRTQLTWANSTLSSFMFTAQDGSTQSLTRRMLDSLADKQSLQRVQDPDTAPDSAFYSQMRHSTY